MSAVSRSGSPYDSLTTHQTNQQSRAMPREGSQFPIKTSGEIFEDIEETKKEINKITARNNKLYNALQNGLKIPDNRKLSEEYERLKGEAKILENIDILPPKQQNVVDHFSQQTLNHNTDGAPHITLKNLDANKENYRTNIFSIRKLEARLKTLQKEYIAALKREKNL